MIRILSRLICVSLVPALVRLVAIPLISGSIVATHFVSVTDADTRIPDFDPLSVAATRSGINIEASFCVKAPHDRLCNILPHDVSEFRSSLVYTLIERDAQDPFDVFSWQTFVALNRPLIREGPLPWQTYDTPKTLFRESSSACGDAVDTGMVVSDYLQSQGHPLIDQSGNYVVFDVRINPDMADYIRENGLTTWKGQRLFRQSGRLIDYPKGNYDIPTARHGGRIGAMAIKSAWRIMDNPEDDRYLTRRAWIAVESKSAIDDQPRCHAVTLALVGFHVMRRTATANGSDWVWSTFEHEDNAPFAGNARGPNKIFDTPLFTEGCSAPEFDGAKSNRYGFFDPMCTSCPTNRASPNPGTWKWHPTPPFAGNGAVPAQVTRCWRPAASTRRINAIWRKKLGDDPLAHYQLSTTQWKGAPVNALFPNGEVPRYLTNTTMETFIQSDSSGTCLGCHARATDAHGGFGGYSFILARVRKRGTQAQ